MDGAFFISPLTAALAVAQQGPHPWPVMRAACVQLVECYADRSLDWGLDATTRMQMALQYLLCALAVSQQHRTLTHDVIGLSSDRSGFASAVPDAMALLLSAATSSSTTPPISAPLPPAAAADPKAKAPPKGAPAAAVPAGPDGRDALFLLSAMLREGEPLWLDGFSLTDAADLHTLLKQSFPLYASRCSLAATALPSIDQPTAVQVSAGAVGSLYVAARMPEGFPEDVALAAETQSKRPLGLFSHVAAFFVLGAKDAAGQRPPELTKIVLLRRDLVGIGKKLRNLRDRVVADRARGAAGAASLAAGTDLLAEVLRRLCSLLAQGFCDTPERAEAQRQGWTEMSERERERDPTPRVTADPSANSVRCVFPAVGLDLVISLDEATLGDLADVLSCDKDWEPRPRAVVCGLLRAALGYRE